MAGKGWTDVGIIDTPFPVAIRPEVWMDLPVICSVGDGGDVFLEPFINL
jgi:hypothetical protein